MGYYRDIREYLTVLEENGQLIRVNQEINKDTELMPLVRLQFRGLDDQQRKAFLFENVVDVKGKRYNGRVIVGSHAASRRIYSLAMGTSLDEIAAKWEKAQLHPVKPRLVSSGPCQDEIHMGSTLEEHGGLEEFAIPISTPGFDNAPYFSAGNSITRDPRTGIGNVGNYRCMVKSPNRIGLRCQMPQHLRRHWLQYKERGVPLPVAISISPVPTVGIVATTAIPFGVDELHVAGGISGEPVEVVRCQTVDLEVPATSEVVIEGIIPTDALELEGPFGEFSGYMGLGSPTLFMNITAITHRKDPIWNAYISQFPPSESSLITMMGLEASHKKLLKHDLGIDNLIDVAYHAESGGRSLCVIKLKNATTPQVWQALYGTSAATNEFDKIVIAVDDDIDARDMDSVAWAICYRTQPDRDIVMVKNKAANLDPSVEPPEAQKRRTERPVSSGMLIDATRKWGYPPTSLPKEEFMIRAQQIWEKMELPPLRLKTPWYGTNLGYWTSEIEEEARLALKGQHYETGEKFAQSRMKI